MSNAMAHGGSSSLTCRAKPSSTEGIGPRDEHKGKSTVCTEPSPSNTVHATKKTTSFVDWLTYGLFLWVSPVLFKPHSVRLDDLFPIRPEAEARALTNTLHDAFSSARRKGSRMPLLSAMLVVHGVPILQGGLMFALEQLLALLQVLFLGHLLDGIARKQDDCWLYSTALLLSLSTFLRNMLLHIHAMKNWQNGMNLRSSTIGLVYRKILTMSYSQLNAASTAKLLTLIMNDVESLYSSWYIHSLWIAPIQALIAIRIGWLYIGNSILAGFGFLLCLLPIQMHFGRRYTSLRVSAAISTGKRTQLIKSAISGIKTVKITAAEQRTESNIQHARNQEEASIWHADTIKAVNITIFFCLISACTCVSLLHHVSVGNTLTKTKIFTTASLFGALRLVFAHGVSTAFILISDLKVSFDRIRSVLDLETIHGISTNTSSTASTKSSGSGSKVYDTSQKLLNVSSSAQLLSIRQFSCAVTEKELSNPKILLRNVNLECYLGDCIAVVGSVGSGKSSLLLGILGELDTISGTCNVTCPALYVPQRPFLAAGTIRSNILFGSPYEQPWYNEIVHKCELKQDILSMSYGDMTAVGLGGDSLSGGQRARIGLARSIYRSKFVARKSKGRCLILLDDPYSALDQHVAARIHRHVIGGLMKSYGVILTCSSHMKLKGLTQSLTLSALGDQSNMRHLGGEGLAPTSASPKLQSSNKQSKHFTREQYLKNEQLTALGSAKSNIQKNEGDACQVKASSLLWFILNAGPIHNSLACGVLFLLTQLSLVLCDNYLVYWASLTVENQTALKPVLFYISVVCFLIGVTFVRSCLFFQLSLRASTALHRASLKGVVDSPMEFFDSNSIGFILNRFGKDMHYIDEKLPETLVDFFQMSIQTLSTTYIISRVNIYVAVIVFPSFMVFLNIRRQYMKPAREIKALEAATRTPIYTHLSESISGLQILHSFPVATARYETKFYELLDQHTKAFNGFIITSRWLGSRLDCIIFVFVTVSSFTAIHQRHEVEPTSLALGLTYVIQLTGIFQWAVRQSAEVENQLASFERLVEFKDLPNESEYVDCGEALSCPAHCQINTKSSSREILAGWPCQGAVEMHDVTLRYAEGLPLVLKGMSCSIRAGQRVGIVGRTGAGKSSLFNAILRMSRTGGAIFIDNIPTCSVPLKTLRERITSIPQDPSLPECPLRECLAGSHNASDDLLWKVLRSVQLEEVVKSLPQGLSTIVTESRQSFSVGQKQLLCIARALVSPTKLILLDEATSNIDANTDKLIQSTLRSKFIKSTVLTIAHRLDTVMDYDLLLVLDQGRLVDSGCPSSLSSQPGGIFSKCRQS